MTLQEVARLRAHSQGLLAPSFNDPATVVRWFGGMQAQDYKASLWAIGARMSKASVALIMESIENRQIVRTWPMRGTLHFVLAEDAHWMLDLTVPRIMKAAESRYRDLNLVESDFVKSYEVLKEALRDQKRLNRKDALSTLTDGGVDVSGQRGYHILSHLARQGDLAVVSSDDGDQAFVLFDDWLAADRRVELSGDAALAELSLRYIRSHGPVTIQDVAWYTGFSVKECTNATARIKDSLLELEDGYLYAGTALPKLPADDVISLVPAFDESVIAFKNRDAIVDPEDMAKIKVFANGMFKPVILLNGQCVGIWRQKSSWKGVAVTLELFRPLTESQHRLTRAEAERFATFWGLPLLSADIL